MVNKVEEYLSYYGHRITINGKNYYIQPGRTIHVKNGFDGDIWHDGVSMEVDTRCECCGNITVKQKIARSLEEAVAKGFLIDPEDPHLSSEDGRTLTWTEHP